MNINVKLNKLNQFGLGWNKKITISIVIKKNERERERERKRDRKSWERESGGERDRVCVCVSEWVRVCVCERVWERKVERESKYGCTYLHSSWYENENQEYTVHDIFHAKRIDDFRRHFVAEKRYLAGKKKMSTRKDKKERRTSRRVQGNKKSGRKRRHLVIVIRNLVEIKKFKLKRKKEERHYKIKGRKKCETAKGNYVELHTVKRYLESIKIWE